MRTSIKGHTTNGTIWEQRSNSSRGAKPTSPNDKAEPTCHGRRKDLEGLNPAVTIPEFEVKHFDLKPVMFNMLNTLGQFGGSPAENARQHLKPFLEIYNSFKIHGVSNNVLKLKLFPYSLRDKAKAWLNNLPPGSFQSWTELCRSFLAKFSYNNMTDNLHNQITSLRQEYGEAMRPGSATEIYSDAAQCMDCPSGLKQAPKKRLRDFGKLAQNDYQHPTTRRGNTRRDTTQLDSSDTILAQISALTNMAKNMQRQPNIQEVKAIDAFCEICGNNHDASECGQNPESSCYVGEYNKNVMSNTYNPAWRKHPNFSWQNQNNTLNPSTSQGYQS
ncbi:hypothetical protein V6N12_035511 [Hibiscus sabdariffa]|uniref:Retrotransposon gag domain-containing protein n=1 Tax=Hibiscus sabdariffa TaxID=183260 RepID=A0ABR2EMY7_9ROSI